ISIDVLPAQASSVPCKHIFSSNKEICTLHQNNLFSKLMEALKFKYQQEGLSFTSDLITKSQDYSITELMDYAACELITTNNFKELYDLVNNDNDNDL
ncbi:hypothetical protein F5I97DRAFT_1810403, partial [Phlebopus sp. FC_14]